MLILIAALACGQAPAELQPAIDACERERVAQIDELKRIAQSIRARRAPPAAACKPYKLAEVVATSKRLQDKTAMAIPFLSWPASVGECGRLPRIWSNLRPTRETEDFTTNERDEVWGEQFARVRQIVGPLDMLVDIPDYRYTLNSIHDFGMEERTVRVRIDFNTGDTVSEDLARREHRTVSYRGSNEKYRGNVGWDYRRKSSGEWTTVWITGIDTADVVDGQEFGERINGTLIGSPRAIFHVDGNKQYTTPVGSTKTVLHLTAIDEAELQPFLVKGP